MTNFLFRLIFFFIPMVIIFGMMGSMIKVMIYDDPNVLYGSNSLVLMISVFVSIYIVFVKKIPDRLFDKVVDLFIDFIKIIISFFKKKKN